MSDLPMCKTCGHKAVHFSDTACLSTALGEAVRLRRALVELAEAASLVVAEWDLMNEKHISDTLGVDVERLRARVTKHMPVIEACK